MKKTILILIILSLLLFSCAVEKKEIPKEKACTTTNDCVPATCCHPKEAVNKQFAPDCTQTLCTAVCEPNTLDCGQGKIECIGGECKVIIY